MTQISRILYVHEKETFNVSTTTYINGKDISVHYELDEFLCNDNSNKFAVFFIYALDEVKHLDVLLKLASQCRRMYVIFPELHPPTLNIIKILDRSNVSFFFCGDLNFELSYAKKYSYMSWIIELRNFYTNNENLQQINYSYPKKYYFELLLGRQRDWRDKVFQYINTNFKDTVFMTYFKDAITVDNFAWPPGVPYINDVHICDQVKFGNEMLLAAVINTDIYNNAAYSVVPCTYADAEFTFLNEKTVKPIIGKRLFLLLSGPNSLKLLRTLGFKTFDGIIDESYDLEVNQSTRFSMVFEQMRLLTMRPQEEVMALVQPIVEFNFNHLMTNNWDSVLTNIAFAD